MTITFHSSEGDGLLPFFSDAELCVSSINIQSPEPNHSSLRTQRLQRTYDDFPYLLFQSVTSKLSNLQNIVDDDPPWEKWRPITNAVCKAWPAVAGGCWSVHWTPQQDSHCPLWFSLVATAHPPLVCTAGCSSATGTTLSVPRCWSGGL